MSPKKQKLLLWTGGLCLVALLALVGTVVYWGPKTPEVKFLVEQQALDAAAAKLWGALEDPAKRSSFCPKDPKPTRLSCFHHYLDSLKESQTLMPLEKPRLIRAATRLVAQDIHELTLEPMPENSLIHMEMGMDLLELILKIVDLPTYPLKEQDEARAALEKAALLRFEEELKQTVAKGVESLRVGLRTLSAKDKQRLRLEKRLKPIEASLKERKFL